MRRQIPVLLMITLLLNCFSNARIQAEEMSEAEKNFEYLWQRFDTSYGNFTAKRIDWTALYKVYRPKITACEPQDELFELMARMLSHLDDPCVCLWNDQRFYRSGQKEGFTEGERQLQAAKISREVIVNNYLRGFYKSDADSAFIYGWLRDYIGYLQIDSFDDARTSIRGIDRILGEFKDAKSLVLDIRGKKGGDKVTATAIANRFADRRRLFMISNTKNGVGHHDFAAPRWWLLDPRGSAAFTKPVVLLIDHDTRNAAELFALAMKTLPQVTTVGEPTSGCFAEVYEDILPNGWRFSLPYSYAADPECSDPISAGIEPDLSGQTTQEDIAARRDQALEFACDYLNYGGSGPDQMAKDSIEPLLSIGEEMQRELSINGVEEGWKAVTRLLENPAAKLYNHPDDLALAAENLAADGKNAEALKILEYSAARNPDLGLAHGALGEILLVAGEIEAGVKHLEQAQTLNTQKLPWEQSEYLKYELLQLTVTQGLAAAVKRYQEHMNSENKRYLSEDFVITFSNTLAKLHKSKESLDFTLQGLALYPSSAALYLRLAQHYLEAGGKTEALDSVNKSLHFDPEDTNAQQLRDLITAMPD